MSNNDWKNRLGIVFSTNKDLKFDEQNEESSVLEPSAQNLKIYIDRKQRAGKEVTLVEGFVGPDSELQQLAKLLKTKCGAGGSAKEGLILVQGDFRQKIKTELDKLKYKSRII